MGSGPGKAVLERPGVGQTPGGHRKWPRIHCLHADRALWVPVKGCSWHQFLDPVASCVTGVAGFPRPLMYVKPVLDSQAV